MKKFKLSLVFAAVGMMLLASCGEVSSKGNWTQENKDKADTEVATMRSQVETMMGDKTDAYLDCYLEKVEANYANFDEANGDMDGCTKLATECMEDM